MTWQALSIIHFSSEWHPMTRRALSISPYQQQRRSGRRGGRPLAGHQGRVNNAPRVREIDIEVREPFPRV
jgi:hypothetical protein